MRVLVITSNFQQASFRLRIEQLKEPLAELGIELDLQERPRSWLARRSLLSSAKKYDATILQRKLLDPADARLLRRKSKKLFYDIDDAVMFHQDDVGALSRWRTARRFEATARIADTVVAGNQYLAEMFHQRGRPVTVLPTCVNPADYRVKQHSSTGAIGLVWIGSSSTLPYLIEQLPAIQESAKRIPGLRLTVIADRPLRPAGLPIQHIPWSVEGESEALLSGDIGIAPTPSNRWTLGKCGFKIVQYMAAGLPVIASPVGANADIVLHNQTGLHATSREQWIESILRLANQSVMRRELGRFGRQRVEREYSTTRAAETWAKLLTG